VSRNRIKWLLVKGELPRGHGDTVKPHVESGAGQIGVQPVNKRLIVIAGVGQKDGSNGLLLRMPELHGSLCRNGVADALNLRYEL